MIFKVKNIIGRPVYTRSGVFVGNVVDLEFNIDSWLFSNLIVKKTFFGQVLVIVPKQIVEINSEKIIIEDAFLAEGSPEVKNA